MGISVSFMVKVNISALLTVEVLWFVIIDKTLDLLFSFIHLDSLVDLDIDIKFFSYSSRKLSNMTVRAFDHKVCVNQQLTYYLHLK